jgi:hypothetical protein
VTRPLQSSAGGLGSAFFHSHRSYFATAGKLVLFDVVVCERKFVLVMDKSKVAIMPSHMMAFDPLAQSVRSADFQGTPCV